MCKYGPYYMAPLTIVPIMVARHDLKADSHKMDGARGIGIVAKGLTKYSRLFQEGAL